MRRGVEAVHLASHDEEWASTNGRGVVLQKIAHVDFEVVAASCAGP